MNRPSLSPIQSLKAISALINGIWDDPNLEAFGPLSTDKQEDILEISDNAIANYSETLHSVAIYTPSVYVSSDNITVIVFTSLKERNDWIDYKIKKLFTISVNQLKLKLRLISHSNCHQHQNKLQKNSLLLHPTSQPS